MKQIGRCWAVTILWAASVLGCPNAAEGAADSDDTGLRASSSADAMGAADSGTDMTAEADGLEPADTVDPVAAEDAGLPGDGIFASEDAGALTEMDACQPVDVNLIDGGADDAAVQPEPDVVIDVGMEDTGPAPEGHMVTGPVGEDGLLIVALWIHYSTPDDHVYKWTEATAESGTYTLIFPSAPPPGAVNANGLAVALVSAFPAETVLPEGILEEDDPIASTMLGHSTTYSIIYKAEGATDIGWLGGFQTGYSCGAGEPAPDGVSKDIFVPIDCSSLAITLGPIESLSTTNFF